jgi:hypothetical protein
MPEHWQSSERWVCTAAFIAACAVLGAVACAAWAMWFVTPHGPPPAPGEPRCGTGYAIVLPFAFLFGGIAGAVGGLSVGTVLAAALHTWGWLRRRWP